MVDFGGLYCPTKLLYLSDHFLSANLSANFLRQLILTFVSPLSVISPLSDLSTIHPYFAPRAAKKIVNSITRYKYCLAYPARLTIIIPIGVAV